MFLPEHRPGRIDFMEVEVILVLLVVAYFVGKTQAERQQAKREYYRGLLRQAKPVWAINEHENGYADWAGVLAHGSGGTLVFPLDEGMIDPLEITWATPKRQHELFGRYRLANSRVGCWIISLDTEPDPMLTDTWRRDSIFRALT
jgi:hypothetical protein